MSDKPESTEADAASAALTYEQQYAAYAEAQAAYDAYYGPGASAAYAAATAGAAGGSTAPSGNADAATAAYDPAQSGGYPEYDSHKSAPRQDQSSRSGYGSTSGPASAPYGSAPPSRDSGSHYERDGRDGRDSGRDARDGRDGRDAGRSSYGDDRERSTSSYGGGDRYGSGGYAVQKSSDTVYISGLGTEMSEKDLTAALIERFSTIGVLKIDKKTMAPKIRIYTDSATGAPKGDATVTYDDPGTIEYAIKWFNGTDFHGH
ncbi:hypothetical protein BGZ92_011293, partial [Podila epicladia]